MKKKRGERLKAPDVLAKSRPVFGKKAGFAEAYPQIESLKVEVEERGDGVTESNHRRVYTESTVRPYDDCHNRLCYNGGVHIPRMLDSMVRTRQETLEQARTCQGYEGSPKGKVRRCACLKRSTVRISIKYKPEAPSAQAEPYAPRRNRRRGGRRRRRRGGP